MSKPVTRMGDPGGGLALFAAAYLLFLYVPVLLLPLFSFNDSVFTAFPLVGFTTKWYTQAFADADMLRSLVASLQVGGVVAVISTILGLFGAKAVTRYRMPGQNAVTALIMLPLFVPEIVLGIALLILVNGVKIELSLLTIGVGHVMLCTPFAMAVLTSRLDGFDKSLEEASMDLGESPWMTFWRVTFPLVAPGIVSSLLLTFIVSFDEFLLSFFLSGAQPTLPVFIFSQLKFPNKLPGVLALGTLILVSSCILVVVAEWVRQLGTSESKVGVCVTAMPDHIIRIENVTKQFMGGAKAVADANFDVERGEFFSLLGPSGCGKTTLLRMIAGFEFPTEGEIFIDGQPSSLIPSYKRPTNMVFQSYAIFPHLNVFDNIAYGLRKDRLSRRELTRRVDEALAMIKLQGFGSRRGDQLSGGQRQRVALARALVKRPKVLLLDEPLGALDKKLREEMQIELRQLQKSVGITFVFVTHDQEEALSMSDRIAVMGKGVVLQIAAPKELYEAPNSVEVATFIGNINLIDATVRAIAGGEATLEGAGFGQFRAPANGLKVGEKIVAAIRPEKLSLTGQRPAGGAYVEGSIKAAAYLGDRSHYQVFVKGRDAPVSVAAQNVERAMAAGFDPAKPVYIVWDPRSLILLRG